MGDTTFEDALYDEYLDAVLRGEAEDPEAFLSARLGGQAEVREEMKRRFGAMQRMAAGPHPATPASDGPPAAEGLPFERLGPFRLLRALGGGTGDAAGGEDGAA